MMRVARDTIFDLGDLGEYGHGAACARVYLQHIHFFIFIHHKLDVEQAFILSSRPILDAVIDDVCPLLRLGDMLRGVHGKTVARMHACPFDMLHDAHDQHVRAVATASSSISFPRMYLSTSTGLSGETCAAMVMYSVSSVSL